MDDVLKEYVNLGVLGLNTVALFAILRVLWSDLKSAQAARIEDMKALAHELDKTRAALTGFSTELHEALHKAESLHIATREMLQKRTG